MNVTHFSEHKKSIALCTRVHSYMHIYTCILSFMCGNSIDVLRKQKMPQAIITCRHCVRFMLYTVLSAILCDTARGGQCRDDTRGRHVASGGVVWRHPIGCYINSTTIMIKTTRNVVPAAVGVFQQNFSILEINFMLQYVSSFVLVGCVRTKPTLISGCGHT